MSRFPSLPDPTELADVFRAFPRTVEPLIRYHDALLRAEDSPLTVVERELIAGYVSGLNACAFCTDAHRVIAEAHGLPEGLLVQLVEDLDHAAIDDHWRPLLRYVAKLTREPAKMTDEDAAAVYNAGWSEAALFEAIAVCALFNFMNRIVDGSGVTRSADKVAARKVQLEEARDKAGALPLFTYSDWARKEGLIGADA